MSAKLDEISRRLKKAIEVEDHVAITKDREGIVKYKGPIDGKNGIFYGIELTKGNGKTNGTYKGKQYFTIDNTNDTNHNHHHHKKHHHKGIFVDRKQILYKIDANRVHERKRSSISQKVPDIFHSEYLRTKHGKWYEDKGIDPIEIIINNPASKWLENASKASTWKQKWQLLKEFMKIICDDEYGKLALPNRFIPNEDNEKVLKYFVTWLQKEKHLGLRKHILKILVPWCKTYDIDNKYASELAKSLIQKQWKETKYGFRGLVTKALLSIYYASECNLEEWKPLLIPVIKSRSDVRVQVWNFLAQVVVLGSKTKNTEKKQKALLDVEMILSDTKIIMLMKQTMSNHNGKKDKIGFACAEFIFGAKYILPELKSINSVYNEVKQNGMVMNDAAMDEYCQILIKGDNSFDLYEPVMDIIPRRIAWDESQQKCDYCSKQGRRLKEIETKVDKVNDEVEGLKDIVNELRVDNTEYEEELNALRTEVVSTEKLRKLLKDDMKEIEVETFNLKKQIYELQRKEKRMMKMRNGVNNNNKIKMNKLDLLHWDKWNCDDVMQWILSLDSGRYLKYECDLQDIVCTKENVRGRELVMITENDLISFGINDENDRNLLIKHISGLINDEFKISKIHEMSMSPPPMAFNNHHPNNIPYNHPYHFHFSANNHNGHKNIIYPNNGSVLQQEGAVNANH